MRTRGLALALVGFVAVGCFLPEVEFDPTAGKAGAGSGGTGQGGSGGSAGAAGVGGVDPGTLIENECGKYCNQFFEACGGNEANTYDDKTDCLVTCTTSGWPLGDETVAGTIKCRVYHSGLALSTGLLDPHCFHSAEVPTKGGCEVTTP